MTIQIMNLPTKIYDKKMYITCPKLKNYISINTTAGASNFNKSVVLEMDNKLQQKKILYDFQSISLLKGNAGVHIKAVYDTRSIYQKIIKLSAYIFIIMLKDTLILYVYIYIYFILI